MRRVGSQRSTRDAESRETSQSVSVHRPFGRHRNVSCPSVDAIDISHECDLYIYVARGSRLDVHAHNQVDGVDRYLYAAICVCLDYMNDCISQQTDHCGIFTKKRSLELDRRTHHAAI